jgi:dGTP triphosphohydrolase
MEGEHERIVMASKWGTRLLGAIDYVSGMTKTFALSMFRRLHGMKLFDASI